MIEEPQNALSEVTIEELSQSQQDAVARAGWTTLMPVQSRAIPYMLAGRDMMVQARTGSGKTGAFLLPMLERLNPKSNKCQALVLVPTRELARQVSAEAELLCGDTDLRSVAVYGGVGYGEQNEALKKGAHLVVGTPGRVLDHLLRRTLTLDKSQDARLRRGRPHAVDGLLSGHEGDAALSARAQAQHLHVLGHLPAPCARTAQPSSCGIRSSFSLSTDHVHVTDTEHVYYIVPDMGQDRNLVTHHRGRKPDLGDHLLQHQSGRPLHLRRAAALRLRCR